MGKVKAVYGLPSVLSSQGTQHCLTLSKALITMIYDLSNHIHHAATARPAKPVGRRARYDDRVAGTRKGNGFKKHGHQVSRCICNRNWWTAGANIIWNEV